VFASDIAKIPCVTWGVLVVVDGGKIKAVCNPDAT
jgi:hypothetical protein